MCENSSQSLCSENNVLSQLTCGPWGRRGGRDVTPVTPLRIHDLSPLDSSSKGLSLRHCYPNVCCFSFSPCASSAFSLPPPRSCPVQLYPHFSLTLVIGWFLSVSLLLLSHSGASVVAVENGYPYVLFLILPRLKWRRTKLSTGLAPFPTTL